MKMAPTTWFAPEWIGNPYSEQEQLLKLRLTKNLEQSD